MGLACINGIGQTMPMQINNQCNSKKKKRLAYDDSFKMFNFCSGHKTLLNTVVSNLRDPAPIALAYLALFCMIGN